MGITHATAATGTDSGDGKISHNAWDEEHVFQGVGARVWRSTDQTGIVTSTPTAILFDSESFDTSGFHSTSVSTSRMTIPAGLGGIYAIQGGVSWDSNGSGERALYIRVGGTTDIATHRHPPGAYGMLSIATTYSLAAGQYVELMAMQWSGGNRTVVTDANAMPWFSIVWLGKTT